MTRLKLLSLNDIPGTHHIEKLMHTAIFECVHGTHLAHKMASVNTQYIIRILHGCEVRIENSVPSRATEILSPNQSALLMTSSTSYEHVFDNPKMSQKLMTHHFLPKEYQKFIFYFFLYILLHPLLRIMSRCTLYTPV